MVELMSRDKHFGNKILDEMRARGAPIVDANARHVSDLIQIPRKELEQLGRFVCVKYEIDPEYGAHVVSLEDKSSDLTKPKKLSKRKLERKERLERIAKEIAIGARMTFPQGAGWSGTVYAPPRTKKNSPQLVGKTEKRSAVLLPSAQFREFEKESIRQLEQRATPYPATPIAYAVRLHAVFYRERDTGDLLGYLDAIADVLEFAGVLDNDKWIRGFTPETRLDKDATNPRVVVKLVRMG